MHIFLITMQIIISSVKISTMPSVNRKNSVSYSLNYARHSVADM